MLKETISRKDVKIQYCSDLHLEFYENKMYLKQFPIKPEGEILVLAGDIILLKDLQEHEDFFTFCADHFEATYWIPGNHEYYHGDLGRAESPLMQKIKKNVWLVNNVIMPYKHLNLICSTLWSKITPLHAFDIQRSVSDFFTIRWNENKFTSRQFNELHRESMSFLQKALLECAGSKNIIVTHHVPTLYHYPQQYRNSAINEAFAVVLYDFIENSGAAYWIYGHHHTNIPAFTIGTTIMVTNQLGYVQQNEHQLFDRSAIIEL